MRTLQAKVTSKGQVTLPKPLRSKLGIKSGDRLEFTLDAADRVSLVKKKSPGSSAGCGKQFISPSRSFVTVEAMNEGIREAVGRRFSVSRTSGG
ncbi:MAG: AbrB/MazE/SpoVT family DNA-binding domain-containing protein [Opitutales bacterium]|nr:AbrB/MazE/SpoVT family DNA-binding domain-containing protein [Opitutales bacterium]